MFAIYSALWLTAACAVGARPANKPPAIYGENIYARAWRSALAGQSQDAWPHYTQGSYDNTPVSDVAAGVYETSGASGWTSGFFPDILWQLYRQNASLCPGRLTEGPSAEEWLDMAHAWTAPLTSNANLTSTHDLGFLAKPFESARQITGSDEFLPALRDMSVNLANRFVPGAGIISSWPCSNGSSSAWCSHDDSVLVIIDNMMNLALLARSATEYTGNTTHLDIARTHADNTILNHIRPDGSSFHVCDYSGTTGDVYFCRTAQGLADDSTWARGQAWGIYGFAEIYSLTGNASYLEASTRMANWFIEHLPDDGLPFWDFSAEYVPDETPRDSSAATVAASGMLLLQEQIAACGCADAKYDYGAEAVSLLNASVKLALAGEISFSDLGTLGAETYIDTPANTPASRGFESILLHGTSNNNPDAGDGTNFDTGLVYGDFYLVEAANRLLESRSK